MLRALFAVSVIALGLTSARAQEVTEADRALYRALGLPDVVGIMREEGIEYGRDMEDQLFPGRGGPTWAALVEQIYDTGAMQATVAGALAEGLEDDDVEPLLEFFVSDRGRRIIGFEVSARRALMADDIEVAAEEKLAEMRTEGDPRLDLLRDFVEANDIIESNVMGAMNANYAFSLGLIDGGAFPNSMTESDVLADVWSQEGQIREETDKWVYSYLAMAYGPLEDSDIEAYVALSETEAGQRLNRALFAGFDRMYIDISRALGLAAARFMGSQDI